MYRLPFFMVTILFASTIFAQNWEKQLEWQQSPRGMLSQEADYRSAYGSTWNGQGSWMALRFMIRAGGDAELGLTDEQNQRLSYLRLENEIARDWSKRMMEEKNETFMAAAMAAELSVPKDDPMFEKATEEQKRNYVAAQEAVLNLFVHDMQADITETLTPEQMLKVRSMELQLMPEMGLPFPSMFEPLGLSEEQKKQMEAITEEMKAEFDRLIADGAALRGESMKKTAELTMAANKETPFKNQEDFRKAQNEARKKVFGSEDRKRKNEELQKRGRQFTTLLKNRLMNVLTDEQLDKMQALIDNAPDFVKNILAEMKKQREANEKAGNWTPGPDSWRPGDGTPEEFKRKRKAGKIFPQEEKP